MLIGKISVSLHQKELPVQLSPLWCLPIYTEQKWKRYTTIIFCEKVLEKSIYEGWSKITEPYLITFQFGIVDNKCDYFL